MSDDLRRLALCPGCKRQYDASGHDGGSRFRCLCGELVEVPEARARDAAVIRCSSCGGPREKGSAACTHCGADFTLHERDLHTICPHCATRISDRAKFCHSCGRAIAPQQHAGAAAAERCPACDGERRLFARSLDSEEVTLLECDRCAGIWVGREIFELLERRARSEMVSWGTSAAPEKQPHEGRFYRRCVTCDKLMHRENYRRKSGIVVDVCRDHGLWFDHGELEQILTWVRSGGPEQAQRLESIEPKSRPKRSTATSTVGDILTSRPYSSSSGSLVVMLVEALTDFLTRSSGRR